MSLSTTAWAQANSAGAKSVEEVVVTGTRTISNGNNSPTPVTVQSLNELMTFSPTTVADGLTKLPMFGIGSGLSSPGGGGIRNPVANTLNLRGFGNQRNLILIDGMRATPTSVDWTVDVTTMPEMLVQRVDVVTGGVSAVYGSDAISGAVNYVLDHKFNGVKLQAEGGISTHRDAGTWKFGIAAGKAFMDDRLHLEGSYQHFASDGLPDQSLRDYSRADYCRGGVGTAARPYFISDNCVSNSWTVGGIATFPGSSTSLTWTNGGATLRPFVHGELLSGTLTSGTERGGDGSNLTYSMITSDLITDQVFGRADFDFAPGVHGFVHGYYNKASTAEHELGSFGLGGPVALPINNPFLPAAQQAQLSALSGGSPNFTFFRNGDVGAPGLYVYSKTTQWVVTAGLDGQFMDDRFKWSAYYTHGDTRLLESTGGNSDNLKLAASLNSVLVTPQNVATSGLPIGSIACAVTLTNPGLYPGCQPFNPFGPYGPGYRQYSVLTTSAVIDNRMDDVGATVSGRLFDLPAGPLVAALTGEYRKMLVAAATDQPGVFSGPVNCTGLLPSLCPRAPYQAGTAVPFRATENIAEVAFEATAPLLKDLPFAQQLEFTGAVRYADYSVSGGATTWKLGGTWKPIEDLTVRATRSRDIRAPSLYQLFQPSQTSVSGWGQVDPHTGLAPVTVSLFQRGNPDLVPEVARTWTIGAVWAPSFVPGLSLSADYYDIKLTGAITALTGNLLYVTICENSGGTSPYCSLIVRPGPFSDRSPANTITGINSQPLNVALQSTHGVDFEVNYSTPLFDGNLGFRALANYQPSFITQAAPDATAFQQAGYANGAVPVWKVNFMANYTYKNWKVNVLERWRSGLKRDYVLTNVWSDNKVPSIAYTDLTVTNDMTLDGHQVSAFVTVQNLFNRRPRIHTQSAGSFVGFGLPTVGGDDLIGRYFTFGVHAKF